ncbi:MAG: lipopolysaccharide transport periplasmic protein LptA [Burkholderiaceae bacterium]
MPLRPRLPAHATLVYAACLLALLVFARQVQAEQAPPIKIEADQMQYDDRARVNVFTGNVVLVRGEIEIRANRLRISQDADGNQLATATGKPARFVQRAGDKRLQIQGSGQELRFNNQTQELEILGGATLTRSRAGQPADEVQGARIVYQSTNDFFTVEGGKAATSEANPRGRVQVIIQPKPDDTSKKPRTSLRPDKSLSTAASSTALNKRPSQ